jgi:hypothetical protein
MCAKSKRLRWHELATETRNTSNKRICDNFESEGTIQGVHKKLSGKTHDETSPASFDVVLQHFSRSPENL